MANKKQIKEEKEKKKRPKQEGFSKVGLAIAVVIAAVIVAMPQLMRKKSRPVVDVKLNFPVPPDARPASCPKDAKADDSAETVSIIIPYLNEEWFRMEATMQSLIRYTDMSLVLEIMWISDGNQPDKVFASELKAMHPKVKVHENENNLGLIYTKMEAAARARGSVLMFLEPHIIVNAAWLPPLLNRLKEQPKTLLMPSLDAVGEDMSYHIAGPGQWRFEWNLNLVYTNAGQVKNRDQPYMSPATSGGIYAIRKDFWDSLELFDPELVRWGGDHVEASHKAWRCGGRIEVHPCSRIGHWFREVPQRPYEVKVDSVVRNYKRLIEVWFDEYKPHFYKVKPDAIPLETGNLTDMMERRKRLECKDMSWYVQNVDVELAWEIDHICIPGAEPHQGGCGVGTKAAPLHSCITEAITINEYKKLTETAEAFDIYRKAEPCCRAMGRGCKRICGKGESPSS